MKIFIFAIFFLISFSASAAFTGKFSGTGKAVFKSGRAYECYEIFLSIKESTEEFRLSQGGYRCGDLLHAEFDPFVFKIKDGNLIHNGEVFGNINEQELTYSIYDPADNSTYTLTLTKSNQDILYTESWHDGEQIALTVKGKLSLIP